MQLETIYHLILKNGIRNYKFKNSQLRPIMFIVLIERMKIIIIMAIILKN